MKEYDLEGVNIPGVDGQVLLAADDLTAEEKQGAYQWLWHNAETNAIELGRWSKGTARVPYIRADLVLDMLRELRDLKANKKKKRGSGGLPDTDGKAMEIVREALERERVEAETRAASGVPACFYTNQDYGLTITTEADGPFPEVTVEDIDTYRERMTAQYGLGQGKLNIIDDPFAEKSNGYD